MTFQAMKIRIAGPVHLEMVEKLLCETGYRRSWKHDNRQTTDAVFTTEFGSVLFSANPAAFDASLTPAYRLSFESGGTSLVPVAAKLTKPPIGLMPRWVIAEGRRVDILEAMLRYAKQEPPKPVPMEWVMELASLREVVRPSQETKAA